MSAVKKKKNLQLLPADALNLHEKLMLDERGYRVLSDVLRQLSGIHMPLNEKNMTLMACRLAPLFRELHIDSYQAYLSRLRTKNPLVLQEFVGAMTTNTTEFFREAQHFDLFPQVVSSLLERKRDQQKQEIRIWCAAASTGQEPYTIMMTLLEALPNIMSWQIRMLATDIDREALQKGANGLYKATELRNVNESFLRKYFTIQQPGPNPIHRVKKSLKENIRFAEFNLTKDPYPFQFPFDIVFCRNVLIYFETETGRDIVNRIVDSMAVGGFLFVGHSETGMVRCNKLKMEANAVYKRIK